MISLQSLVEGLQMHSMLPNQQQPVKLMNFYSKRRSTDATIVFQADKPTSKLG
jgi:hypothetical protein